jgi:hypothetical protein
VEFTKDKFGFLEVFCAAQTLLMHASRNSVKRKLIEPKKEGQLVEAAPLMYRFKPRRRSHT